MITQRRGSARDWHRGPEVAYDREVDERRRPLGCSRRPDCGAGSAVALWPWLALLIVLAGPGCGPVKDDAKRNALDNTLRSYRQAIRWGQFPAAAGFIGPDGGAEIDLSNIRVTGYEVIQQGVIGPDDSAVQLVQIDYVLEDRQRLEQLIDRQLWRYDEQSGAWWLESGLPRFVAPDASDTR